MTVNLFDASFYGAANPDLAAAGLTTGPQLLNHFQTSGIDEGRQFSPFADLNLYRSSNPGLAAVGLTSNRQLLDHLQNFGVAEARQFSRIFDANLYRSLYPDLQAAGLNNEQLLQHFQNAGVSEGRVASANFDVNFYLNSNPDLRAAGFNNQQALAHFVNLGLREGRLGSASGGGGNQLGTAVDFGNLTGTRSVSDFVGNADPADIYRFILGTRSNLSVTLNGLSADADVDIIQDFNGNGAINFEDIVAASLEGGTNPEAIALNALNGGTYFVPVFQSADQKGDTNYNLSVTATPV